MNLKKIIAREGLIFLGIIVASIFLGYRAYDRYWTVIAPGLDATTLIYSHPPSIGGSIFGCMLTLYLIYLIGWSIYFIIRFIIWAIKTLKGEIAESVCENYF